VTNGSRSNGSPQSYGTQGINSLWQYTSQPEVIGWEYQAFPSSPYSDLLALNEAGAAGWELCHVGALNYLMKRKVYRQATRSTT
jgi:hypothetical protein